MAGSITVTSADAGGGITKYSIAWTSDASGAVSGNPLEVKRGRLTQWKFIPGASAAQPTDAYDVTISDADGADILQGEGANLSNATATYGAPSAFGFFVEAQSITPVIANAGNAKGGTIHLYIGP